MLRIVQSEMAVALPVMIQVLTAIIMWMPPAWVAPSSSAPVPPLVLFQCSLYNMKVLSLFTAFYFYCLESERGCLTAVLTAGRGFTC